MIHVQCSCGKTADELLRKQASVSVPQKTLDVSTVEYTRAQRHQPSTDASVNHTWTRHGPSSQLPLQSIGRRPVSALVMVSTRVLRANVQIDWTKFLTVPINQEIYSLLSLPRDSIMELRQFLPSFSGLAAMNAGYSWNDSSARDCSVRLMLVEV